MIQLIVRHAYPSTKSRPFYECTLDEWDLGVPIGYGCSIPEAIEDFLDSYDRIFISWNQRPITENDYKWKAKPTFYG